MPCSNNLVISLADGICLSVGAAVKENEEGHRAFRAALTKERRRKEIDLFQRFPTED